MIHLLAELRKDYGQICCRIRLDRRMVSPRPIGSCNQNLSGLGNRLAPIKYLETACSLWIV